MTKNELITQLKILGFKEHNIEHFSYYLNYGENPVIFKLSINKNHHSDKTEYKLSYYNKSSLLTYNPIKIKDIIISYFNRINSGKYNSQEQEVE